MFLLVPNDLHIEFPASGPVEFAKIDSLPCAQQKLSILDYHGTGRAHERSLYMGVGIPFKVKVFSPYGISFIQGGNNVPHNVRVGVFVYCDPGCCMGHVNYRDAVPHVAVPDVFSHRTGYVDKLLGFRGPDFVAHRASSFFLLPHFCSPIETQLAFNALANMIMLTAAFVPRLPCMLNSL